MFGEIFYQKCITCGAVCGNNFPVCPDCIEKLQKFTCKCENCGYPSSVPAKICGNCLNKKYYDNIFIEYVYSGSIKQLLREIKFSYRLAGIHSLSRLAHLPADKRYDIVTAVPSHFTRRFRRFTHPAQILAKHIAGQIGAEYENLLTRTRKTEYQYKLKRTMRMNNVKNAFSCKKDLSSLKILLVDDIITTGSTISECCRILRRSGASDIDVFALTGGMRTQNPRGLTE